MHIIRNLSCVKPKLGLFLRCWFYCRSQRRKSKTLSCSFILYSGDIQWMMTVFLYCLLQ